jgi:hypothetical protein
LGYSQKKGLYNMGLTFPHQSCAILHFLVWI